MKKFKQASRIQKIVKESFIALKDYLMFSAGAYFLMQECRSAMVDGICAHFPRAVVFGFGTVLFADDVIRHLGKTIDSVNKEKSQRQDGNRIL